MLFRAARGTHEPSIEVNRRARRAKSDRLDVAKLLTILIGYHGGKHKL